MARSFWVKASLTSIDTRHFTVSVALPHPLVVGLLNIWESSNMDTQAWADQAIRKMLERIRKSLVDEYLRRAQELK